VDIDGVGCEGLKMSLSVEDVKMGLGDFAEQLIFEDSGDYIIAKVKKFLPGNEFAKLASKASETFHGEYMKGLGKNSHFRWSKQQATKPEIPVDRGLVSEICYYAEQILERAKQLEKK